MSSRLSPTESKESFRCLFSVYSSNIYSQSPKPGEGVVVSEETEVKAVLAHTNPTWWLNKFLIRA